MGLIYQSAQDMITLADNKANYTLSIQAIILGLGLGFYMNKDVIDRIFKTDGIISIIYSTIFVAYIVFSLLGIIYSIKVYIPQKPHNKKEENRNGVLYFGHIFKYESVEKYLEKIKNMDENMVIDEMGNQVYALSFIAKEKMNNVTKAIILLLFSIIAFTLLLSSSFFL